MLIKDDVLERDMKVQLVFQLQESLSAAALENVQEYNVKYIFRTSYRYGMCTQLMINKFPHITCSHLRIVEQ